MTTKTNSSVLAGKASSYPLLSSPPRQRLVTKDGHCTLNTPACPSDSWRRSWGRVWLLALQDLWGLLTQLTIGYGTMFPSGDCPSAIALLAVQMLLGLMLEAFITGAFVAKIARPQKRAGAIEFSPQAVVGQHQGQTCLMIRVTNLIQRPLVDVKVSAVLYEEQEGQALYQTSLDFHLDHLGQQPCPFFIFPLTFYHQLDRQSPLYPALCEGTSKHFELVIFLTALQEGTGDSCQKRTSYLRQEIQFDRRFLPALGLDARGRYLVNKEHFDTAHSKEPLNKDCVVQINGDDTDRME
ncbi:inward rectifier potassium channel 13 isoform X2 [Poecilia latipinna]|uniref:inward rectifier potassium channel 13 isoform X2 n=1 Tax=Poecilia formosa TaxID=48698 RepID=UPI000443BBFB|nr:PREDICTED: inward rectifier potassium channel 13 isoform X2 [Poecilia formosa]XP_014862654.1 PREDICTED: inward rectifier potassium channel 13 isoform X2 [Poecilia mexicana]XP_014908789.1 PREDICTED: inward rectifier potassium channel 13 isoform X2 [Poecilia latipinna]